MNSFKKSILAICCAFTIGSCSTDFDIIGPYEDHTIVFGLLNASENIHFIKINKSYLGDGDAYVYAGIQDSSEYANLVGSVEEWQGGSLIQTFQLQDTLMGNRDSGIFYYPTQTIYYFTGTLNTNSEYRLKLSLLEGTKEVTATTTLITNPTWWASTGLSTTPFSLANANSSVTDDYPNFHIGYYTAAYVNRYDTWLTFYYDEYTVSGSERKNFKWKIDTYESTALADGELRDILVPGKVFYQYVASKIAVDPAVTKRVFRQMDILVVGASEDLYTYMKLNEPSTGLIQERPSFTNIENGIGLFSSRSTLQVRSKVLNQNSMNELCNGQYTYQLLFCHDSLPWAAQTFYCP